MQRFPFLSVKPLSSVTPAMREVQDEIEALYSELIDADIVSSDKADQTIQKIRQLEQQLIEMRIAQAGYCSQL